MYVIDSLQSYISTLHKYVIDSLLRGRVTIDCQ